LSRNDLDKVIQQVRETTVNSDAEVSIDEILKEIKDEAFTLKKKSGRIPRRKKQKNSFGGSQTPIVKFLKKVDGVLLHFAFYKNIVRPRMRGRYGAVLSKIRVNARNLLRFEDEQFIDALYINILLREPDIEGKLYYLHALYSHELSKTQLIYHFARCEEARQKKVKVYGLTGRRIYEKIKKMLHKVPGLRYIVKWFIAIILLPRRMESVLAKIATLQEGNISNSPQIKSDKAVMDKFYMHYNERLMPDSREAVKGRASIYLKKLSDWCGDREKLNMNIVDLGCGECEWVELLCENGYPAKGVDSNSEVVRKVKRTLPNIHIIEDNAFDYLRKQPDNSLDLITSFHMVEHMDITSILELLKECKRALNKGGMLIVETPNPQNILVATYYFYLDPTHIKPIPQELMEYLISEAGLKFQERVLLYPLNFCPYEYKEEDPIKDIVFRFNMEQAYSVLAVKQ